MADRKSFVRLVISRPGRPERENRSTDNADDESWPSEILRRVGGDEVIHRRGRG